LAVVRLNRRLINDRRIAAGLTLQQLADRAGVDRWLLHLAEPHDGDGDVAIDALVRLSDALDLSLEDLISEDPSEPGPPADGARAAAALVDHGRLTRSQLAETLGWTLPDAAAALRRVERSLRGSGLRLRRVGAQAYRIEADLRCLTPLERGRLRHLEIREGELGADVAAVLLAVVRGLVTEKWLKANVGPDDNAAEVLLQARLVLCQHHGLEITPAVGYSLDLHGWDSPDELPTRDPLVDLFRRL